MFLQWQIRIQLPNEPKIKKKENLYGASTVNNNIWICTDLTGKIRCCQSQKVNGFIAISHLTRCIKTYTSQSHGSTILLMYFVDSFVLNGWWLLICSTLFRASYKSHLWCLCTQIQMPLYIQEYPKIGQLPRARTPTLSIYIFFYSRNMRNSCVFFTLLLLYILLRLVCSFRVCILLLFLLIYSVHLKLFANFIWCRRMPSFLWLFKIYCILYNGVWLSIMFSFCLHLPNKQATGDVDRHSFFTMSTNFNVKWHKAKVIFSAMK